MHKRTQSTPGRIPLRSSSAHLRSKPSPRPSIFRSPLPDTALPSLASHKSACLNLDKQHLLKRGSAELQPASVVISRSIHSNKSTRKIIDCLTIVPGREKAREKVRDRPQSALIKKTHKRPWSSYKNKVPLLKQYEIILPKQANLNELDDCVAFCSSLNIFVRLVRNMPDLQCQPINNEFIVRIFGRVDIAGISYFVAQNFNNSSVRNILESFGPSKEQLVRMQIRTLICGVIHLNSRGIVHNRINPDNIHMGRYGNFLIDIVKATTKIPTQAQKQKYLHYFSPELMTQGTVHEGCDIWAIGCLTLQMLTGDIYSNALHPYNKNYICTSDLERRQVRPYQQLCAKYEQAATKNKINYQYYYEPLMSDAAISFISGCLMAKASQRESLANVLDHEFLREKKRSIRIDEPFLRVG